MLEENHRSLAELTESRRLKNCWRIWTIVGLFIALLLIGGLMAMTVTDKSVKIPELQLEVNRTAIKLQ